LQEKKQNISPIKQRILQFVENLGISKRDFCEKTGISRGTLESHTGITEETITKFFATYPDINPAWLFTGSGAKEISKDKNKLSHCKVSPIENCTIEDFRLQTDGIRDEQQIPLFDLEAVAGLIPLFNDATKHIPVDYIKIPNLPKCDGAIYITGDSMYPLLKSGDIVLYKQVHDISNGIFWGEMYLLSVDLGGEEYVTVKYIQKSDIPDCVRLVSYNQHHGDKDVLLSSIRALAFVKASVRVNSMK
jgi:phage repressor protein C with HTH and peptisase S24 domain